MALSSDIVDLVVYVVVGLVFVLCLLLVVSVVFSLVFSVFAKQVFSLCLGAVVCCVKMPSHKHPSLFG